MTREAFENIAFAFAEARVLNAGREARQPNLREGATTLELQLLESFKEINPRFDEDKFMNRVVEIENRKLGRK